MVAASLPLGLSHPHSAQSARISVAGHAKRFARTVSAPTAGARSRAFQERRPAEGSRRTAGARARIMNKKWQHLRKRFCDHFTSRKGKSLT
jgi:hypothetical protein